MVYYELKIHGDDLLAIPCGLIDISTKDIIDGCDHEIFPNKKVAYFFKRFSDGEYDIAWGQDLWIKGGKVYFLLGEVEHLSSDTPIDKFSWEGDEDITFPNHNIILKDNIHANGDEIYN